MERFTASDGVEIAYYVWGTAGPLPPVVLHHGFIVNASSNWFLPGIVTALTSARRQVVAIDARGHGASGKPHDPAFYGQGKMAQDLRRLFDIIGTSRIDLVGYSMGAIVSLIVASQDQRVRRLVVGGIGAAVIEQGGVDTRVVATAAIAAALLAPDPSIITNPVALAFRALADRVGADREALAAHIRSERAGKIPLNQITAPTLVVAGDNDIIAARPELLAAAIPDARTLLVPGDHLSAVRTPQFASAIVEFLAS